MVTHRGWIIVVLSLATAAGPSRTASGRQPDRLPVRIEAPPPGPHYVGQSIPIRLLVTAEESEPAVDPPDVPDAELIAVGVDVRPVSAGAIGTIVHETNLYRFTYFLVPRRAGPLLVPAFRARVGGRSGASGPIRLEARQPPAAGRPPWFLGGVGPLEVELIARPEAVRLGDPVVVEVRLTGPGALGSTSRPSPRFPDGAEVGPMPPTASLDPPSRTIPYRYRPGTAGETTIDPVLVSWFDPGSKGYRTVGSRSVTIRVDDPPRFDPSMVEVATPGEEAQGPLGGPIGRVLGAIGAAGTLAGIGVLLWRRERRRRRSPGRFAALQARRIAVSVGRRRADLVAGGLVGYLSRAIDRPDGELTPPEARVAVEAASGDPELADRAARLVVACDAVRFSGRAGPSAGSNALDDAESLFRDLARVHRPEPGRTARATSSSIDDARP